MSIQLIEEKSFYDSFDISELVDRESPLVIRGLLRDWEVLRLKDSKEELFKDYLLDFYNEHSVHALIKEFDNSLPFGFSSDFSEYNYKSIRGNLRKIFRNILDANIKENPSSIYVGSEELDDTFPGFQERNNLKIPGFDVKPKIWIGNRTHTATHFDEPDNLACVVRGERRFTLFPPSESKNLHLGPYNKGPGGRTMSLVNINNPEIEKFPRYQFAKEKLRSVTLYPGDCIYIPSMWWHNVEAVSDLNVLVNYWWNTTRPIVSIKDILRLWKLSTSNMSETQKLGWTELLQVYIGNEWETQRFTHKKSEISEVNIRKEIFETLKSMFNDLRPKT